MEMVFWIFPGRVEKSESVRGTVTPEPSPRGPHVHRRVNARRVHVNLLSRAVGIGQDFPSGTVTPEPSPFHTKQDFPR